MKTFSETVQEYCPEAISFAFVAIADKDENNNSLGLTMMQGNIKGLVPFLDTMFLAFKKTEGEVETLNILLNLMDVVRKTTFEESQEKFNNSN